MEKQEKKPVKMIDTLPKKWEVAVMESLRKDGIKTYPLAVKTVIYDVLENRVPNHPKALDIMYAFNKWYEAYKLEISKIKEFAA